MATHVHQAETRYRLLAIWPEARTHSTRSASRVDKEPTLHLKCLEAVGTTPQQDIDIHLSSRDKQCVSVGRWHDGVAMGKPNS